MDKTERGWEGTGFRLDDQQCLPCLAQPASDCLVVLARGLMLPRKL